MRVDTSVIRSTGLPRGCRDTLVPAAMQHCHEELVHVGDTAENPAMGLRGRILAQVAWAEEHPDLYKVLHESKVHRRLGMPFKEVLVARTRSAVQRCMAAGLAPADDPATVTPDLRHRLPPPRSTRASSDRTAVGNAAAIIDSRRGAF
ncbi:hypothetical protein [Nocardia abscessus]|uniref:hypothetical protein n=1 Tax=Nocardia abscessus TaxID=120957 RepID=UPI001E5E2150|nr:hypothetical protein [Nocardia abscessus]